MSGKASSGASHGAGAMPSSSEGVLIGNYLVKETLGQGTFGKVKLGIHTLTKEKVAVKILEKAKIREVADAQRVAREIKILKRVRHANVIQLFEVIDTPKQILLVMEHLDSGELFDYIVKHQKIREDVAVRFFHDIVDGLAYLHKKEVAHRDLKPENILMDRRDGGYRLKIIDFGLSNTFDGGKMLKTACGSPCYAAPELLTHQPYKGECADIWSLGVVLFAMVCGYLPYEDANTAKLYDKILRADYRAPRWISNSVRDLLAKLFVTDPTRRYTIADIRRHPWYTQIMVPPSPIKTAPSSAGDLSPGVVAEVERLGIDRVTLSENLFRNAHNNITATYYLIAERMLRNGDLPLARADSVAVDRAADSAPISILSLATPKKATATVAPLASADDAKSVPSAPPIGGAAAIKDIASAAPPSSNLVGMSGTLAAPSSPASIAAAARARPKSARSFAISKLNNLVVPEVPAKSGVSTPSSDLRIENTPPPKPDIRIVDTPKEDDLRAGETAVNPLSAHQPPSTQALGVSKEKTMVPVPPTMPVPFDTTKRPFMWSRPKVQTTMHRPPSSNVANFNGTDLHLVINSVPHPPSRPAVTAEALQHAPPVHGQVVEAAAAVSGALAIELAAPPLEESVVDAGPDVTRCSVLDGEIIVDEHPLSDDLTLSMSGHVPPPNTPIVAPCNVVPDDHDASKDESPVPGQNHPAELLVSLDEQRLAMATAAPECTATVTHGVNQYMHYPKAETLEQSVDRTDGVSVASSRRPKQSADGSKVVSFSSDQAERILQPPSAYVATSRPTSAKRSYTVSQDDTPSDTTKITSLAPQHRQSSRPSSALGVGNRTTPSVDAIISQVNKRVAVQDQEMVKVSYQQNVILSDDARSTPPCAGYTNESAHRSRPVSASPYISRRRQITPAKQHEFEQFLEDPTTASMYAATQPLFVALAPPTTVPTRPATRAGAPHRTGGRKLRFAHVQRNYPQPWNDGGGSTAARLASATRRSMSTPRPSVTPTVNVPHSALMSVIQSLALNSKLATGIAANTDESTPTTADVRPRPPTAGGRRPVTAADSRKPSPRPTTGKPLIAQPESTPLAIYQFTDGSGGTGSTVEGFAAQLSAGARLARLPSSAGSSTANPMRSAR